MSGRDARVDMLRGLAVLFMSVALCAPSDGPLKLFALTEYATAPLFALLIGVGAELADRGSRGLPAAFVRAGIRAAVLVALGWWLATWGAQVDIVLMSLALPTLLAPLLARLPVSVLLGVATLAWAAGPALMEWARPKMTLALVRGDTLGAHLWDVTFAGPHYRLTTLLVFTCLGVAIWRALSSVRSNWHVGVAGLVAIAAAAALMTAREAGRLVIEPYSGSHLEVVFTVLLVGGVAALWFAAVPERFAVPALAVAGAMTLTVYTAQIAYLAWFARTHPGQPDDSWLNVALLSVGGLVLPLVWRSVVPREPWTKGPIEGPTAFVTRVIH